nr:hypothetical protein CFP56_25888 [Quercus suber]
MYQLGTRVDCSGSFKLSDKRPVKRELISRELATELRKQFPYSASGTRDREITLIRPFFSCLVHARASTRLHHPARRSSQPVCGRASLLLPGLLQAERPQAPSQRWREKSCGSSCLRCVWSSGRLSLLSAVVPEECCLGDVWLFVEDDDEQQAVD